MRNFFIRLAVSNLAKNKPVYFPFFLTNVLSVMIFFIMASIQNQSIIQTLPGSYIFVQFLKVGVVLTGLLAGVFLMYTNQLLLRQRKKELGLYNIFGLEKKHMARVLCCESLLLTAAGIAAGVFLGIALGKLFFLILLKLLHLGSGLAFHFSKAAFIQTIACFAGIGIMILLYNLLAVNRAKPIELLYAAHKGDTYQSFVGVKAVLGGVCLVGGYALILSTPSPIAVIGRILPVAILILAGTYFFFSSVSVVLLEAVKRNDKYYYNPKNFISVSGLIFRLKQNSKGLSAICILSAVVMVIATTTLSLYVGQREMLSFRFPMETKISIESAVAQNNLQRLVTQTAEEYHVKLEHETAYQTTYISGVYKNNTFSVYQPAADQAKETCGIYLITLADYNRIEGASEQLAADELLVFSSSKDLGVSEIHLNTRQYRIKAELPRLRIHSKSALSSESSYFLICPTQRDITQILAALAPAEKSFRQTCNMMFDADGEQEGPFNTALRDKVHTEFDGGALEYAAWEQRSNACTYGGFLFVGLLLSLLFMIFLTLVIYYKQITEGYSDRYNFEVMQKVGLDTKEIKAIVRRQTRMVFFFPLFAAIVHLAVSLYAIAMLLATLSLTNTGILLLCAGAICALFVLIYLAMYFSTASVYYRIVTTE